MTEVARRTVIKGGMAVTGGALLGGPFQGVVAAWAHADEGRRPRSGASYGPLRPTPDKRDGVVRLALPEGFQYRSFNPAGSPLSDGTTTPGRHDGMASFGGHGNNTVLIRNHEINGPVGAFGDPGEAYDPAAGGGTVTLLVSPHGEVHHSEVSINGTQNNCAGGDMPWGSWVTCEETVNGPDVGNDFTRQDNSALAQKHGYIFEVPVDREASREPIRMAGRFAHEAAAYDPHTKAIYLTEDNFAFPSGFYRYHAPQDPAAVGEIRDGGRLQMLAVTGQPNKELSGHQERGTSYAVTWVDIDDPDPTFAAGTTNDQAIVAVGDQGRAKGAANFSRLEGAVYDAGLIYFTSTQGGAMTDGPVSGYADGRGQVWAYDPRSERLHLIYESPSKDVLDLPDNITASRSGTLVLCEDGGDGNYLRGVTREGAIFDFARNAIAGAENEEFAGSTFSPSGATLFVNIQSSKGLSFAIWGPWARGPFG